MLTPKKSVMHNMITHKLNANIVDLWVDDVSCNSLQQLLQDIPLSEEEQQKAASFYFAKHRRHYELAHQYLRWVLSQYLGLAPSVIEFTQTAFGKPSLARHHNTQELQFNLSHSDSLIAVAIGKTHALGVDIETMKTHKDINTLAEHCFSTQEWQAFSTIESSKQPAEFYRHWSRKEAYIKAIGTGLHTPTTSFSIDVAPKQNPTPVSDVDQQSNQWKIWTINTDLQDCACAVATVEAITFLRRLDSNVQPTRHLGFIV